MKRVLPAAIVILISVMAVLAIVRVRFSSDVFELLPQDLPEARGLEQINRYFSRDAQLIITLDGQSARSVSEATASLASTLSQQKVFIADVFREVFHSGSLSISCGSLILSGRVLSSCQKDETRRNSSVEGA